METIPRSALELGLNFEDYENVARNIHRVSLISGESRKEILRCGQEKFQREYMQKIFELQEEMANDREVYKLAKLDYSEGPPEGEQLFITGIVDYLLRNSKTDKS